MSFSGGSTSMQPILTEEQTHLLNKLIKNIGREIGRPGDVYPGEIAPGPSPLQEQAFGLTAGLGGPAQAAYLDTLSGRPAYEVDPAARERAYSAIEAQTMGQFRQQLPYLEERYNAMGAGRSGGLQHAMAQTAGDVSLGLGALRGQYEYQDEMARRAAAEAAAGRQMAAAGGAFEGMTGLGRMQRQITAQQMGEGYNKWLMAQPYANPWLGYFPQALGTQVQTPVQRQWGFSLSPY